MSAVALPQLSLAALTSPLGLGFHDAADGGPVRDGLRVTARPVTGSGRETMAVVTPGGRHAFHRLPGLARFGFAGSDATPGADFDTLIWSAAPLIDFVVSVSDKLGRFLPMRFVVAAPARGLAIPDCLRTSPPEAEATIPLFSAPARPVPCGYATIYAQLRYAADGAPAAWARVTAELGEQPVAAGVADAEGRLALIFPYPMPAAKTTLVSPPDPDPAAALFSWALRLRAFHAPPVVVPDVPPLCDVLAQPEVGLLHSLSPPAPLTSVTLQYGSVLTVATAGSSFLLLG